MADPRGWIAQPVVQLSTVPTLIGDHLAPRHVDLRPFAVNDGNRVWVLPGGLTRVALPEGELIVNSSRGGGSKDTWVLAGPGQRPDHSVAGDTVRPTSRVLDVPAVPRDVGPEPTTAGTDGPPADVPRQQQQQQQQQEQQSRGPAVAGC
jgi:hypothetical protein